MSKPPKIKSHTIPEKVGYRQPPRHSRFRKGQSGNPRGRPKGSMNLKDMVRKRMLAPVDVRENGRARKIPMLVAILAKSSHEALRGRPKIFIDLCKLLQGANLFTLEELEDRPTARDFLNSRVTVRIIRPDPARSEPSSNSSLPEGSSKPEAAPPEDPDKPGGSLGEANRGKRKRP